MHKEGERGKMGDIKSLGVPGSVKAYQAITRAEQYAVRKTVG